MSFEFDSTGRDTKNESSSSLRGGPPEDEFDNDSFETREPNAPPRGLMRKRRHPIVWIGLALLLGGLIALMLTALITD
jgi:hypothetical protein